MPKAIPNRRNTQLRLDEVAFEKAKAIAAMESRTMNSQFEYFIKAGIQQYEAEHGEISLSDSEE